MIRYIAATVIAACLGQAAQAQIAGDPARENAFLAQIELAKTAPEYRENRRGLDVARALLGGGLPLTAWQRATAGENAMNRGVPIEAEMLLQPLVETGEFAGEKDSKRARNASLFAVVQADADADRTGGLEKSAESAAKKLNGMMYVVVGEGFSANGEHARAVQLITAGLSKGAMGPVDTSYAMLDLGIAQFRAGQVDQARATWGAVGGDGGAKELAGAWLMIAQG